MNFRIYYSLVISCCVLESVRANLFLPRASAVITFKKGQYEQHFYRVGEILHGQCQIRDSPAYTAHSLIIKGQNPLGDRLQTFIHDEKTLVFNITYLKLEDWDFSCSRRLDSGGLQLIHNKQVYVGRKPMPIDSGNLVVDDWNSMNAWFTPTYEQQLRHCLRENSSYIPLIPNVSIQWSPGRGVSLSNCSYQPDDTMRCVVNGSDYLDSTDDFVLNVTVRNVFGSQNKLFYLPERVRPEPVIPTAKALSSSKAEVQWFASTKHLRYNLTLVADNVQHKVTITENDIIGFGDWYGDDRIEVDNLVPHGKYHVYLRRMPIWKNGTERGYYSDEGTTYLVMHDDVPVKNPEILPAYENIILKPKREIVVYLAPIKEKYRNGLIHVQWKLIGDNGDRTGNLTADQSALKIDGLNVGKTYELTVWAVNDELGRNESLPANKLTIQPELEPFLSGVQAAYLPDGRNISIILKEKLSPLMKYYVVHCQLDLVRNVCKNFPTWFPLAKQEATILLSSPTKPNTHRVGAFVRRPTDRGRLRRRNVDDVQLSSSSRIVWSPCVYNLSSVPKRTPVELEACTNCIQVNLKELPCDDTGVKVDSIMLKTLYGPKRFSQNLTSSGKILVSPGHYTVLARAVSRDGMGPEIREELVVPGGEENLVLVAVGIFGGILASGFSIAVVCVFRWRRRKAVEDAANIRLPEVDVPEKWRRLPTDVEVALRLDDFDVIPVGYERLDGERNVGFYTEIAERNVPMVTIVPTRSSQFEPLPSIPEQYDSGASSLDESGPERLLGLTRIEDSSCTSKGSSSSDSGISRHDTGTCGTGSNQSLSTSAPTTNVAEDDATRDTTSMFLSSNSDESGTEHSDSDNSEEYGSHSQLECDSSEPYFDSNDFNCAYSDLRKHAESFE